MCDTSNVAAFTVPTNSISMQENDHLLNHLEIIRGAIRRDTKQASLNVEVTQNLANMLRKVGTRVTAWEVLEIEKVFVKMEIVVDIMRSNCYNQH